MREQVQTLPQAHKDFTDQFGIAAVSWLRHKMWFWQRMQNLKLTLTSFTSCGHWFVVERCMHAHANVSLMEMSCYKWGHCMRKKTKQTLSSQVSAKSGLTKWRLNNRPELLWVLQWTLDPVISLSPDFTFIASLTLSFIRPLTTSTELLFEACFMAVPCFCFCCWGRLFYDAFYVDCFYAVSRNCGVQYIKPARPLK